jgi:hypothetical protein
MAASAGASGSGTRVSLGAAFSSQAATQTPPHPKHNIAAKPDYFDVCASKGTNNPACIKQVLSAIERARSHEHMKKRAMILPSNYRDLTIAEQTFVVTNLERVDRGLKPFEGLSTALSGVAKLAATLHVDPTVVTSMLRALNINSYGSNWAGDIGPLSSDYDWMYNDGYASDGVNLACVTRKAEGCWGHRTNILWTYASGSRLDAGAGTAKPAGASIALILAGFTGNAPTYSYTWKNALRHGANGHGSKHQS